MLQQEKLTLEEYKYNLLLGYMNQNRILYNYRDVVSLGFSWTAFKRFATLFEAKYPKIRIVMFSPIRSFIVWAEDEDAITYYRGKDNFKKMIEDYMIEWLTFNNKINSIDAETQRKYKKLIRRFRRYGKMPTNLQF